jgi:hypothetical protein
VFAYFQQYPATAAMQAVVRRTWLAQPAMHAVDSAQTGHADRHVDFVVLQSGVSGQCVNTPNESFIAGNVQMASDRALPKGICQAGAEVARLGVEDLWLFQLTCEGRADGGALDDYQVLLRALPQPRRTVDGKALEPVAFGVWLVHHGCLPGETFSD